MHGQPSHRSSWRPVAGYAGRGRLFYGEPRRPGHTIALPDIARSFNVTPLDLSVGVSTYLLTLGVLIAQVSRLSLYDTVRLPPEAADHVSDNKLLNWRIKCHPCL